MNTQMTGWKPIATAPKDGTKLEFMNEANGLRDTGYWHDYRGQSMSGIAGEWSQDLGSGDMTHWRAPLALNLSDGLGRCNRSEMMPISKEALEAVEAIRRDLKVRVSINTVDRYYDSPARLKVTVELVLGDDVISKDEELVDVPD